MDQMFVAFTEYLNFRVEKQIYQNLDKIRRNKKNQKCLNFGFFDTHTYSIILCRISPIKLRSFTGTSASSQISLWTQAFPSMPKVLLSRSPAQSYISICWFANFLPWNREQWYFVTKIVLTYCEKKLFLWSRKFFEIRGWRPRIWNCFEITGTI